MKIASSRILVAAFGLLAGAAMLTPAEAKGQSKKWYGAVAVNYSTGYVIFGESTSRSKAEQVAMSRCKSRDPQYAPGCSVAEVCSGSGWYGATSWILSPPSLGYTSAEICNASSKQAVQNQLKAKCKGCSPKVDSLP